MHVINAPLDSWKQPVLRYEGKVSCSRINNGSLW